MKGSGARRPRLGAPAPAPRPASGIGARLEARLPGLLQLWRSSIGSPFHGTRLSTAEAERAGQALLKLQRGLTGDRRLAGAGYMDDPDLLGAYLLYYWPVSYLEAALALAMIGRKARRVLDLGSGPGPLAAAFLDQAGTEELHLADGSQAALKLARELLEARPEAPPSPRRARSFVAHRLDLEGELRLPAGPFDAICLGHALNELWKDQSDRLERRLGLLEAAAQRLAPEGFLLVLEPALLSTSRELLALRDALAAHGWRVAAPCLRQGPCPALAQGPERTCHAEHPWAPPPLVAALAQRACLDRSSVKATWFALLPPGGTEASAAFPAEGEPALSPADCGPARVVSAGLLNKAGRLRYLLCGEAGYANLSAPADSPRAQAAGFRGLRRYDLLRIGHPELREGGFGLGPESELELLAPAPSI